MQLLVLFLHISSVLSVINGQQYIKFLAFLASFLKASSAFEIEKKSTLITRSTLNFMMYLKCDIRNNYALCDFDEQHHSRETSIIDISS